MVILISNSEASSIGRVNYILIKGVTNISFFYHRCSLSSQNINKEFITWPTIYRLKLETFSGAYQFWCGIMVYTFFFVFVNRPTYYAIRNRPYMSYNIIFRRGMTIMIHNLIINFLLNCIFFHMTAYHSSLISWQLLSRKLHHV